MQGAVLALLIQSCNTNLSVILKKTHSGNLGKFSAEVDAAAVAANTCSPPREATAAVRPIRVYVHIYASACVRIYARIPQLTYDAGAQPHTPTAPTGGGGERNNGVTPSSERNKGVKRSGSSLVTVAAHAPLFLITLEPRVE